MDILGRKKEEYIDAEGSGIRAAGSGGDGGRNVYRAPYGGDGGRMDRRELWAVRVR